MGKIYTHPTTTYDYRGVIRAISIPLLVVDGEGFIELMNPSMETLLGMREQDALTQHWTSIIRLYQKKSKKTDFIQQLLEEEQQLYLIRDEKDEDLAVACSISFIYDDYGQKIRSIITVRDISNELALIEKVTYLSYHDQLTGLYNRHYFDDYIKMVDNKENYPLGVIMADVNGLKLTNDAFGHRMGDRLLKKIAQSLKNIFGDRGMIARIGGDEFVIILKKIKEKEIEELVQAYRTSIKKVKLDPIQVSISMGWEVKISKKEEFVNILKIAEEYMYKTKLFEGPVQRSKTVETIISTLYERNKSEEIHSQNVASLSVALGSRLGLDEKSLEELKTIGLFHDIGKIAISKNLLEKKSPLNRKEWEELKRHSEIGYNIMRSVNEMAEIATYVLHHHENWDGSGYPKGLKGEEIPLQSRILKIVDAFDAMGSERPYRAAYSREEIVNEIKKCAGILFDPRLVKLLLEEMDIT